MKQSLAITRFAPSPTGFLHLGGARTAFFNWLFARAQGGQFLLRIEDTDYKRSTPAALDSILKGLAWLGLHHDGEPVFQSKNSQRHKDVAQELLKKGRAYWCDAPPSENTKQVPTQGHASKPVLRFKIQREGTTGFDDLVQGSVEAPSDTLNDFVLLRSDGSPTYMLAVVADDHDMGITHVIRGVDHLTNAYHQKQVYEALGWPVPHFAHIPLIHGADGAKLSKRHGALDVNAYKAEGFLPEAMLNALLRLGWGHGNQEIFSVAEALKLFNITQVGRNPARFDLAKLRGLNATYLRQTAPEKLLEAMKPFYPHALSETTKARLLKGLPALAERAETLKDLAHHSQIYDEAPPKADDKAAKILNPEAAERLARFAQNLQTWHETGQENQAWNAHNLEAFTRQWAEQEGLGLGKIAQPLRAKITGRAVSPPLFDVMAILGPIETLKRLCA